VLPQGPGVLVLSLAAPMPGGAGARADAVYAQFCGWLVGALGIAAAPPPDLDRRLRQALGAALALR